MVIVLRTLTRATTAAGAQRENGFISRLISRVKGMLLSTSIAGSWPRASMTLDAVYIVYRFNNIFSTCLVFEP
jgi:hypothetical protein